MISKRTILAAVAALVPLSVARAKTQKAAFPSVESLQSELNLYPGRPFPKLILFEGRAYEAFYEGASYLGDGTYSARVHVRSVTSS